MTPWIVLALIAVAVVLFFGLGRKNVERADVNRAPTTTGMGRRPVDDRTVRPNDTPRPNTDPDLQGAPHDPNREVILPPLPADPNAPPAAPTEPAPAPVER